MSRSCGKAWLRRGRVSECVLRSTRGGGGGGGGTISADTVLHQVALESCKQRGSTHAVLSASWNRRSTCTATLASSVP